MTVTTTAITSATTMESHIPSTLKITGSSITAEISKTSVRKNEMMAEVSPSERAVKKEEPKMAKPANKNANENIVKPRTVRLKSALS